MHTGGDPRFMNFSEYVYYKNGNLYRSAGKNRDLITGLTNVTKGLGVKIKGKMYKTHRVVYELHYGTIPEGMYIDHINRDYTDNRIENLRLATPSENIRNSKPHTDSTSKYLGVNWYKSTNKWRSCIRYNGQNIHLGYFNSEEEAALAYNKKAKEAYGEFANLNIIS